MVLYINIIVTNGIILNSQTVDMKNQSTNKMPQATCSGDVMGGSTVRGMLGAFCFQGGRHGKDVRLS